MFLFLELTFPYLIMFVLGTLFGYSIPKSADGAGQNNEPNL